MNYFTKLSAIDVSEHVKQKGNFSYLSWPFAVEVLGQHHPDADIKIKRFPLLKQPEIMVPYLETPVGYFVEVSVSIDNVTRSQLHPILDYKNQPVLLPTPFDINTSIQRALVKAIAMHGLGLFIYQGEDLPINAPDYTEAQLEQFNQIIEEDDALGMYIFFHNIPMNAVVALYGSFAKGQKVKMKELVKRLENKGSELITEYENTFMGYIDSGDSTGLIEAATDLGEAGKAIIWQRLSNEHQTAARELLELG